MAFRTGLCSACYRATGKGLRKESTCTVPGCGRFEACHRGMCSMHYQRWRRENKPAKKRYRTTTADLVRLVLVIEEAAAGVGELLNAAQDGPVAWPVVEDRLVDVWARLRTVRRAALWDRMIRDMRHAEDGSWNRDPGRDS